MSIKLMSKAWECGPTEPSHRLLLLAIADHANDDGVCWPAVATVARKSCLSERQARRIIRTLEADGYLVTDEQRGRNHSNRYIVHIPPIPAQNRTSVSDLAENKTGHTGPENRTSETQNRTWVTVKSDIAMSGESSLTIKEPSIEPSYSGAPAADAASDEPYEPNVIFETLPAISQSGQESSFLSQKRAEGKDSPRKADLIEAIYRAYPRKVGKVAAEKAIANALKVLPYAELLEATQAYAQAVARWTPAQRFTHDGRDTVPHPATWFNRGSYADDRKEWERKAAKKVDGPALPRLIYAM